MREAKCVERTATIFKSALNFVLSRCRHYTRCFQSMICLFSRNRMRIECVFSKNSGVLHKAKKIFWKPRQIYCTHIRSGLYNALCYVPTYHREVCIHVSVLLCSDCIYSCLLRRYRTSTGRMLKYSKTVKKNLTFLPFAFAEVNTV